MGSLKEKKTDTKKEDHSPVYCLVSKVQLLLWAMPMVLSPCTGLSILLQFYLKVLYNKCKDSSLVFSVKLTQGMRQNFTHTKILGKDQRSAKVTNGRGFGVKSLVGLIDRIFFCQLQCFVDFFVIVW